MCCCFLVFLVSPSRTASGLNICSWDTLWRGNLQRRRGIQAHMRRLSLWVQWSATQGSQCSETAFLRLMVIYSLDACTVYYKHKSFSKNTVEYQISLDSKKKKRVCVCVSLCVCVFNLKPVWQVYSYTPLNFLGGLVRSPASGWTTHLSSTSL